MKKHFRNFCVRGMTFAWTGPVILAVVWLCLERAGIVSMLTVNEAVLGIVSSAIMAFVAAGISIVYQIENIPKAFEPSAPCLQTQDRLAPVASYIDIVAIWALIYGAT